MYMYVCVYIYIYNSYLLSLLSPSHLPRSSESWARLRVPYSASLVAHAVWNLPEMQETWV